MHDASEAPRIRAFGVLSGSNACTVCLTILANEKRKKTRRKPVFISAPAIGSPSSTRKPARLGSVKLDNILRTCDEGNCCQTTERSQNRIRVFMDDRWTFVMLKPSKNDFRAPDWGQTRNLLMTSKTL